MYSSSHHSPPTPTQNMDTKQAIELLKSALPSAAFAMPGTPEYAAIAAQYQSDTLSETNPACFVQPSSTEEVSIFVKTIKPFALSGATPFAIVGLGQQPAPSCSNIDAPGITLSLRRLKGVHVKDGKVEVGGGENWGSIYDALVERGLGFTGGRSYRSGIGGLALAGRSRCIPSPFEKLNWLLNSNIGGLSFVSSREGFICDNVSIFRCHISEFRKRILYMYPCLSLLFPRINSKGINYQRIGP